MNDIENYVRMIFYCRHIEWTWVDCYSVSKLGNVHQGDFPWLYEFLHFFENDETVLVESQFVRDVEILYDLLQVLLDGSQEILWEFQWEKSGVPSQKFVDPEVNSLIQLGNDFPIDFT